MRAVWPAWSRRGSEPNSRTHDAPGGGVPQGAAFVAGIARERRRRAADHQHPSAVVGHVEGEGRLSGPAGQGRIGVVADPVRPVGRAPHRHPRIAGGTDPRTGHREAVRAGGDVAEGDDVGPAEELPVGQGLLPGGRRSVVGPRGGAGVALLRAVSGSEGHRPAGGTGEAEDGLVGTVPVRDGVHRRSSPRTGGGGGGPDADPGDPVGGQGVAAHQPRLSGGGGAATVASCRSTPGDANATSGTLTHRMAPTGGRLGPHEPIRVAASNAANGGRDESPRERARSSLSYVAVPGVGTARDATSDEAGRGTPPGELDHLDGVGAAAL